MVTKTYSVRKDHIKPFAEAARRQGLSASCLLRLLMAKEIQKDNRRRGAAEV